MNCWSSVKKDCAEELILELNLRIQRSLPCRKREERHSRLEIIAEVKPMLWR